MATARFNKTNLLKVLDHRTAEIVQRQRFDRSNGTSQLNRNPALDALVTRAIEYGRLRAFEQIAESVEEGFSFETIFKGESSDET